MTLSLQQGNTPVQLVNWFSQLYDKLFCNLVFQSGNEIVENLKTLTRAGFGRGGGGPSISLPKKTLQRFSQHRAAVPD